MGHPGKSTTSTIFPSPSNINLHKAIAFSVFRFSYLQGFAPISEKKKLEKLTFNLCFV